MKKLIKSGIRKGIVFVIAGLVIEGFWLIRNFVTKKVRQKSRKKKIYTHFHMDSGGKVTFIPTIDDYKQLSKESSNGNRDD